MALDEREDGGLAVGSSGAPGCWEEEVGLEVGSLLLVASGCWGWSVGG